MLSWPMLRSSRGSISNGDVTEGRGGFTLLVEAVLKLKLADLAISSGSAAPRLPAANLPAR